MKKLFPLLAASALAMSLTACGNGSNGTAAESVNSHSSASSSSTYTLDEGEESRILFSGSRLTLTVHANPTTGYSWVVDDSDSDMLKVKDDRYVEDSHEKDMVGVGGTETFTIDVLQSGTGRLIFEYKQDWDGGESDGKYQLNVTAAEENGKLTVTDAVFVQVNGDTDSGKDTSAS